jgi:hypothetical protein
VTEVTGLIGIPLNSTAGMSSEIWNTYTYGYKNVYVWSGGSWVLSLTTGDRQWYKHALTSYVPQGAQAAITKPSDWVPAHGYGPIYTNYSYLWNNSSLLDQTAESNDNRGIYTYVPWYNS